MAVESNTGIKNLATHDAWRLQLIDQEHFLNLPRELRLKYLCEFGMMAASSHNSQPEAFAINPKENTIGIFEDKKFVLHASDVDGRQAIISVGWTMANILKAAEFYHLETEVTFADVAPEDVKAEPKGFDEHKYVPLAVIKLHEISKANTDLESLLALQTRRVNRNEYNPAKKVPSELIDYLKNEVPPEISFYVIPRTTPQGYATIQLLALLQAKVDGEVARQEPFANELAEYLILNDSDKDRGMPVDTFGILDEKTALEVIDGLGDIKKRVAANMGGFSRASSDGVRSAAFMGVLASKFDTPEAWLKTGMALGRMANILEQHNISMAIHAGLSEAYHIVKKGLADLKILVPGERPLIAFRAGYKNEEDELPPHSPRTNLNTLIINWLS